MRALLMIGAALATSLLTAPAKAASASQPPMNSFNNAFYNCDNNAAFLMSYNANKPTAATMTTSDNNKQYRLKRTPVATGVQFSNDVVKFWTDGDKVTVDGAGIPLQNCKLKPN